MPWWRILQRWACWLPVADEIDAEFTLGAFGRHLDLARGHVEALRC